MADLIAIGYPDETTAHAAADEARRLAAELIIQPDAIAVISRDKDGSYHVTTSHQGRELRHPLIDAPPVASREPSPRPPVASWALP